MVSNKVRTAKHRKALWYSIGVSAAVHVTALAVITMPGPVGDDAVDQAQRFVDESFEAIEVIKLVEETPALKVTVASPTVSPSSSTSGASGTPTTVAIVATAVAIEQMLADLAPSQPSMPVPDNGRPIVTSRDLTPVSQTDALMAAFGYGGGFESEEEESGGGWSSFLGGISAALSGGGHCPTPGGPMILR